MQTCLNCAQSLPPNARFCPHCGQKAATRRLTLHDIVHDSWHALTHTDHSLLGLVRALVVAPGRVAREYVEGRRKTWFNPFAFLMVAVGITTLVLIASGMGFSDPREHPGPVGRFLQRHLNLYFLVQVPVLGLWSRLLFRKNGMNLAENLVLAAYATGLRCLAYTAIVVPLIAGLTALGDAGGWEVSRRVPFMVFSLLWAIFFGWASAQFHGGPSWRARDWLRGCAVELLAFATSFAAIFLAFYLSLRQLATAAQ